MENITVDDNRTLEEIKADIYEAAALGYDQIKAQAWSKKQVEEAIKKREAQMFPKSVENTIIEKGGF